MSKGGDVSVSQNVDPRTQGYVDQLRSAALGYAGIPAAGGAPAFRPTGNRWLDSLMSKVAAKQGPGYTGTPNLPQATIDPALLEALKGYEGYADIGKMGLTALAGGSNPWAAASNPLWRDIRQQTLSDIGADATLSGAFGGDRQAVAGGEAVGKLGKLQAGEAYDRAAQAAGLGLAGLSGQSALAQYMQEYPQLFAGRQLGLLNAGLGPYGTTQTQHMSSDPFSQLLGLGATGLSLFGGGGPLAGLFASQIPGAVDTSGFDGSYLPYIQPWQR